jgi:RNA polymerase primary sigma factor
MGLMTAVDKFDPDFGTRFSTVAVPWIKAAITKALKDYSKTIRIPVHIWDAQSKVRKAIEELTKDGHEPTTAEICAKTGLSELELSNLEAWRSTTVSLDKPLGDDGEDTLADLQADNGTKTPYEYTEEQHTKRDIQDGLDKALDERAAKVIRMRFGLYPYDKEYTLEEVGRELNLTRERIRQIEKKILMILKSEWKDRFPNN